MSLIHDVLPSKSREGDVFIFREGKLQRLNGGAVVKRNGVVLVSNALEATVDRLKVISDLLAKDIKKAIEEKKRIE